MLYAFWQVLAQSMIYMKHVEYSVLINITTRWHLLWHVLYQNVGNTDDSSSHTIFGCVRIANTTFWSGVFFPVIYDMSLCMKRWSTATQYSNYGTITIVKLNGALVDFSVQRRMTSFFKTYFGCEAKMCAMLQWRVCDGVKLAQGYKTQTADIFCTFCKFHRGYIRIPKISL